MADINKAERYLQEAGKAFDYEARGEIWVHLSDGEELDSWTVGGLRESGFELSTVFLQGRRGVVIFRPNQDRIGLSI